MTEHEKKLSEMATIEEILADVGPVKITALRDEEHPHLTETIVSSLEHRRGDLQVKAGDIKAALLHYQSKFLRSLPVHEIQAELDSLWLDWSVQLEHENDLWKILNRYVDPDDHAHWDRKHSAWNELHRRRWLDR